MRTIQAASQANGSLKVLINITAGAERSLSAHDSPKIVGYKLCDGITTVLSLKE